MSIAPHQEDPMDRVRRKQEKMPPYPTGYSWKEFVASFGKGVKPFALTVERQVRSNQHFGRTAPQETFFGVLRNREDGRLGILCFGRATKEFGGSAGGKEFLTIDALDPTFLRTSGLEERKIDFSSPMDYKVIEATVEVAVVDEKITKFIDQMLPERNSLNKKQASELVAMRDYLDFYFSTFRTDNNWKNFAKSAEAVKRLRGHLNVRRTFLHARNKKLEDLIQMNKEEIHLL